ELFEGHVPARDRCHRDVDDVARFEREGRCFALHDHGSVDDDELGAIADAADDAHLAHLALSSPAEAEASSRERLKQGELSVNEGNGAAARVAARKATKDEGLLLGIVRNEDDVAGAERDILAQIAEAEQANEVDRELSSAARDVGRAQARRFELNGAAKGESFEQTQRAVAVLEARARELSEHVITNAPGEQELDRDLRFDDVGGEFFLEKEPEVVGGLAGNLDGADERKLNRSVVVDHEADVASVRNGPELSCARVSANRELCVSVNS